MIDCSFAHSILPGPYLNVSDETNSSEPICAHNAVHSLTSNTSYGMLRSSNMKQFRDTSEIKKEKQALTFMKLWAYVTVIHLLQTQLVF